MGDNKKNEMVFVNPYNFIHFPTKKNVLYKNKIERENKKCNSPKYYGVINYTVTTKTPIFIPNTSNDDAFEKNIKGHKSYDFFSYTDLSKKQDYSNDPQEPVIPGSEMRGVIRNVYETLTDSCMGLLNDVRPAKRVGVNFKHGLLKINKDGKTISLFDAKSYRIGQKSTSAKSDEKLNKLKNGQILYYNQPKKKDKKDNRGNIIVSKKTGKPIQYYEGIGEFYSETNDKLPNKGYLIKWGFGVKKCFYHVFEKSGSKEDVSDLDIIKVKKSVNDLIDSYITQPTIKDEKVQVQAYESYRKDFNDFLNQKDVTSYFPINYAEVKGKYYLAPTTFSKEVSSKSLTELASEFAPCETEFCPACDLFGRISDGNSTGSNIRFSDLKAEYKNKNCCYDSIITISNLSSPKLGNVDFYLKKPAKATFWTYDYYIENNKIKPYEATLRGRKYYWHHQKFSYSKIEDNPSNQNKTIRPVKKEIKFLGKLYFDGITENQLNQLIYILDTGKDNMGYKIGMGKPLGLGSISLKVDSVKERKISLKNGYEESEYNFQNITYSGCGFSDEVKEEFKKITSFDAVKSEYEICYPVISENDKGFEWFQKNHNAKYLPKNREAMRINCSLPKITDSDITLPRFKECKTNNQKEPQSSEKQKKGSKPYKRNNNAGKNKYKPR